METKRTRLNELWPELDFANPSAPGNTVLLMELREILGTSSSFIADGQKVTLVVEPEGSPATEPPWHVTVEKADEEDELLTHAIIATRDDEAQYEYVLGFKFEVEHFEVNIRLLSALEMEVTSLPQTPIIDGIYCDFQWSYGTREEAYADLCELMERCFVGETVLSVYRRNLDSHG